MPDPGGGGKRSYFWAAGHRLGHGPPGAADQREVPLQDVVKRTMQNRWVTGLVVWGRFAVRKGGASLIGCVALPSCGTIVIPKVGPRFK